MTHVEEQPTVVHDEPSTRSHEGDDRRGTRIDTPFDHDFVEALKSRWPHGERMWDGTEEVWWLVSGHEAEKLIEELVIEHFGAVRVVDEDGNETLRDRTGDYEQIGLF